MLWPLAGIIGLFAGSFLNVLAWRWYRSELPNPLLLATRSQCAHCNRTLRWYELIPMVSYIMQRGRCRSCRKGIAWRYPAVELLTGIIFAAVVATHGGVHPETLILLLLASIFLVIALVDLETQLIPDRLSIAGAVVTMIGSVVLGRTSLVQLGGSWFSSGITGFVIAVVILGGIVAGSRGKGMGIGDIKLGAVIGLSLGGPLTLLALFSAFVSGAIAGLVLLARGRASMKTAVPFGPFLVLGWLVAILWGRGIVAWYTGL